jgi:hypothetical protein
MEWKVDFYLARDSICVYIHKGSTAIVDDVKIFVKEPNRIERMQGITLDEKLQRALKKQQKRCDRLNALEAISYEANVAAVKLAIWK